MSPLPEGLNGNKDLKTTSKCFQATMQTSIPSSNNPGASIAGTSNTKYKQNVMCYSNSDSNKFPCTKPTIAHYFKKLDNNPKIVPTAQKPIALTERNTLSNQSSNRKPCISHSIHHYYTKIGKPLPLLTTIPTQPTPSQSPPPTQSSPPSKIKKPQAQYIGPNPYKKKPTNNKHSQALAQLRMQLHNESLSLSSAELSQLCDSSPAAIKNTRTRVVRPPQRWTGQILPPPSSFSSSSTSSGSFVSPVESTTGHSVALSEFVLKELEEISVLTQSLKEMMAQTDHILDTVMNLPTTPPPIVNVPSDTGSYRSHMSFITQPLDSLPSGDDASSHDDISLSSCVTPFSIDDDTNKSIKTRSQELDNGTVHIHDSSSRIFDTLLDDVSFKQDQNYRIILQNVNGIKEFHEKDPDYYPTLRALQRVGADHLCLVETNKPWHVNDLLYDITMVHKQVWSTPTKTVGASCRTEKPQSRKYQPGGVLSITANSLTTKINTVTNDKLGRWSKTKFFAKKGYLVIYSIYRPNPGSLDTSGINSAWMQQYRALCKNNSEVDPRKQFIEDIINDILQEQAMNAKIIVAGDFNEDPRDGLPDGILQLMEKCTLVNAFETVKSHLPSTRSNHRSIDHFLVSSSVIPHITRLGLIPDETGFTSDHAGLFLDVAPTILATKNNSIPPPKLRKLKLYNRIKVDQYIKYVLHQFDCHNIIEKVKDLHAYLKEHSFDSSVGQRLNALDEQVTDIMLRSEDKLSPDYTPYEHSEELDRQMRIVRLIKALKKKQNKNYAVETYVNSDLQDVAAEILYMPPEKLPEILARERQKLLEMQENSWDIRDAGNYKIQAKMAEEKRKDVETIIRDMREREKQSRLFQRIGNALKTTNYAQITRLGLPKNLRSEDTEAIWNFIQSTPAAELKKMEWEYIEDNIEIERRLLEWNILHFNQAHNTPLATPEWQQKLDPINKSDDDLETILYDTLTSNVDLAPETICLLEQIQCNLQPQMSQAQTTITEEHFRSFYQKTPEDKSSSPSGLHLGHYKAASSNNDFSYVLWSILSIAYSNSFCLDRWKTSATILLEKIPGFPQIHKFRTIHLIESDLNFVMRFLWGKQFMAHNETNNSFHDNQYGGRIGRQPQSAILNKLLTTDIFRYNAEAAGLVDNDAKA